MPASEASGGADLRGELDQVVGAEGHVHPVIAAMATCLEALDGVRDAGVGTLSAREIRLMLLAVVQVITAAFALKLRLVVAGEAQRVADLTGAASTAAFLGHLTQTRREDAAAEVRLAHDLDSRFGVLGEAVARGAVSPEQVRVCVAALRRLPRDLDPEQSKACQRFLVEAAQTMTPKQLKVLGRKLWEVVDPDGAEAKEGKDLRDEEELARAKAYFKSWRNGDGTTGFRGRLPDLHADMLLKLIRGYAAPRRRKNPNIPTSQPDDTRHPTPGSEPPAATADEFSDEPGGAQGEKPREGSAEGPGDNSGAKAGGDAKGSDAEQGDVLSDDDAAADPPDPPRAGWSRPGAPPGGRPDRRHHDHEDDEDRDQRGGPDEENGRSAQDPMDLGESPEETQTGKTIPYPVRLGHALMELVERIPADAIPHTGGTAATVVVTIPLDQLRTGLGTATLDTGTETSATQALRLACGAGLVPMVLDGNSRPLHVGHRRRLHNEAMRLAATVHQGGTCGIDGCDRPGTDAHHPIPWSQGGETSVENCLMLCPYHHHLAHHPDWRLVYRDGTWSFHRVERR